MAETVPEPEEWCLGALIEGIAGWLGRSAEEWVGFFAWASWIGASEAIWAAWTGGRPPVWASWGGFGLFAAAIATLVVVGVVVRRRGGGVRSRVLLDCCFLALFVSPMILARVARFQLKGLASVGDGILEWIGIACFAIGVLYKLSLWSRAPTGVLAGARSNPPVNSPARPPDN